MDHPPFCCGCSFLTFLQTVTIQRGGTFYPPNVAGVASHYVRGVVTGRFGGNPYNVRETLRGVQNGKAGVNWRKIKAEYIAGGISQRALAVKHGVNPNLLMRHANKEKWNDKRKAAERKALEKVEQKTAEAVADNAVLLERAKRGLLRRVVDMIENYPETSAAEVKTKKNGAILKYSMKDIAAVLSVLEDKTTKGQSVDMEDLSPLAELLKDE